MADNPWAGIGNMGAIDQKLYQTPKKELAVSTPAENNPEEKPVTKRQIKAKKEAVEEKPAIIEQEIRMTLPLPESSLTFLDQIERTIFTKREIKHRSKQRITKNNVARNWIGLLKEVEIDWNNIKDDADLTARLRKALKK
jgi:hypothetical protein